jgi:hypothetical protein
VSTKNTDINTAMANYNALTGDILKSQFEFSFYDNLTGWVGSLTTLRPGLGYMLKSTASSSFNYPQSVYFGSPLKTSHSAVSNYPHFTPEKYEHTMSVIVKSNICLQNNLQDVALIAQDANKEIRGVATPLYNEQEKDYLYFLTVFGNNASENLVLKFSQPGNGAEIATDKTISFVPDDLLGTPSNPVIASVAAEMACSNVNQDGSALTLINLHPNPFSNSLQIQFSGQVSVSLQLIDVLGKEYSLPSVSNSNYVIVDLKTLNIPSGVYTLRVRGDVNTSVKVVKTAN